MSYERLEITADPGLEIFAYVAEPGSRSAEALDLLAGWTAADDLASADPNGTRGA